MATIPLKTDKTRSAITVFSWENIAAGDECASLDGAHLFADRTIQCVGAFDGGSIALQGSNDGENWGTLSDPQGNPLSAINAASRIEVIMENPVYIRPVPNGGGSGMSVTVLIACRRTTR